MKRTGEVPSRRTDKQDSSAPSSGVVTDAASARAVRESLASLILPGVTDTASPASVRTQAGWVDLLGELEAVKNAATAAQARLAVALDGATRVAEAAQDIPAGRRGRGVPSLVGAAMRSSPHAGAAFLGTARVWLTEMPHTFDALRTGVLSQWRATLLVQETSHLAVEHRTRIDQEVCGPSNLAALARTGTRRLVARVRRLAAELDVDARVRRDASAVSERYVSVRPAPRLMVHLTALVPVQQGMRAYAQLKRQAETARAAGDERGAGQIMADILVERVSGRGTSGPGAGSGRPPRGRYAVGRSVPHEGAIAYRPRDSRRAGRRGQARGQRADLAWVHALA